MIDSFKHKGLRKKLVDDLRNKGITDEKVLAAINAVPRHFFFEKTFEEHAYEDNAFPIARDQTISQPYTVAYQTALLDVQKRDKILEIGTGSGYQASILAIMGARVFTVERQKELYENVTAFFRKHKFGNIRTFYRDGFKGLPEYAPYDKILITAAAPTFPKELGKQLRIGGMLVAPIGAKSQVMTRSTKRSENEFSTETFDHFRFVPMLRGLEK